MYTEGTSAGVGILSFGNNAGRRRSIYQFVLPSIFYKPCLGSPGEMLNDGHGVNIIPDDRLLTLFNSIFLQFLFGGWHQTHPPLSPTPFSNFFPVDLGSASR